MELLLVLGIPLVGAALLALAGHRGRAPEVNVLMSLLTFVAAASLTTRVIADGPLLAFNELFFVDAFNVFLVTLTAFVGFTTSLFSRPYMRIEVAARQAFAEPAAPVSQHVPDVQFHHAAGAADQQHRHPVGGAGRRRHSPPCCW